VSGTILTGVPGAKVPIAAAAVVVYAWWATGLRPFTATSAIAVISAGIVAMAFGRFHCGSPETVRLCGTQVASWGALLGALAAWQFAAYLQHPRSEHPTLSSLANALLGAHAARTLAFLLWLAGAARLARR
jgi:hypothetical protein